MCVCVCVRREGKRSPAQSPALGPARHGVNRRTTPPPPPPLPPFYSWGALEGGPVTESSEEELPQPPPPPPPPPLRREPPPPPSPLLAALGASGGAMAARGAPRRLLLGSFWVAFLLGQRPESSVAAAAAARSSSSPQQQNLPPAGPTVRTFTPFYFTVEPVDTLSVRASSVILNCSAYCESSPKIEWKKDGTFLNLVSDDRRQLLPDGSLLINSVVHSKHNKPDEGHYQCVATVESLGTIVSRTAKLTVAGLPRFISQPESASVYRGNSIVLNCEVNADLAPFVRWELDHEPLFLDDRVFKLPSGALIISNATDEDGGTYCCIIEIGGSPKYSDEAEIKVLPESEVASNQVFLRQPSSLTKITGQNAVLPCVATGIPIPVIRWTRNEEELVTESSKNYLLLAGGTLKINDITEDDAGTYTCIAENGNETIEAQADLIVQAPPEFLKQPSNIYAHESMDIVFECDVTGKPTPTVKWVKNGDVVIPSDYFKIVNEHDLQVLGLVKSDEGFYQCIADNDVGNIQSGAQLIILDHDVAIPTLPPTSLTSATTDHLAPATSGPLPSAPRDVVASLVSTRFIKLTWRTPASDPHGDNLTYSVFYTRETVNRERVENTSHPGEMQVTIQNLMPESVYVFRVVAQNKHGPGESSLPLKVATQPEVQLPGPAPNIRAYANSPTSITISWATPLSGNGEIQNYKLYYMEKGADNEQDIDVGGLSYTISGLKKYTEYSFRVVAYNKHGPGVSTQDVVVRTLSDVPSAAPQNLTLEVQNSKSIMMHWQPPPAGTHNGQITGYKIRYRKVTRKSDVTDIVGTQLSQLIEGLERGTEYSFRVAALTVNGTGLPTDWVSAETFESDLDESRVPEVPSSLHVRPLVTSIVVSWTPPENQNIVVRGYAIGYGVGSPHAQTIKVDYKQRYYTIENLDPSSHYVITLKAYNNVGEGIPLYESAVTRAYTDTSEVDLFVVNAPYTPVPDPSPMMPPVGVQASILSHDTIRITWADNSLPKNQKVSDARYYTVRWKTNIPANTKYKTANTTTLSFLVTGLKPNTLYEFSVMVTKGRRSSTWSMTAHGTTFELVPTSPPKDVTVVSKEGKPRTIIVNWQPPSEANGKITGYIIYYSTDVNAEIHDWVIEPVVGNRLTHQIQELTLDTAYYFKIQARNSKGMGPMSEAVQFRTPKALGSAGKGNRPVDVGPDYKTPMSGSNSPHGSPSPLEYNMLLVIIVSVGVITIVVVVIVAVFCTRRTTSHQKKKRAACKSVNGSHKYKGNSKDVKPPDLWIHHERLELKPIDKSPDPNPIMTDTPIPRNSQDITPVDNSMDSNIHQRRNSYRGHESEDSMSTLAGRRGMRPKMMMPFDSQPPQPVISAHPIHSLDNPHHHFHSGSLASPTCSYLHHQANPWPVGTSVSHSDRANSTESVRNTPSTDTMPASSSQTCCADHQEPESATGSYLPSTQEEETSQSLPTAHVRPSHPLKSFAVPAVPPTGATYDPALPSTPLLSQQASSHPVHSVKTASIGTLGRTRPPMPVVVPSAPEVQETTRMLEDSESNYEPDELTKEMAHLEGLMKDLNAITTA
ncbi:neogenin isoform X2 [Podarcis lilfordi]|uniref:Neogenin n=1 Tax=Podarcis lilfordi TaxID=74358 RepID=A0AA35PL61_9SAUR|nr:neogenin isoform X2 [Podarcis lilfordi]